MNLSSWTVTFERRGIAWFWRAEHADGAVLEPEMGAIEKENAERDAVKMMERHESGVDREEVNGFQLAERVHGRPGGSRICAVCGLEQNRPAVCRKMDCPRV